MSRIYLKNGGLYIDETPILSLDGASVDIPNPVSVTGNVDVTGTLGVTSNATVSGTLGVTGNLNPASTVSKVKLLAAGSGGTGIRTSGDTQFIDDTGNVTILEGKRLTLTDTGGGSWIYGKSGSVLIDSSGNTYIRPSAVLKLDNTSPGSSVVINTTGTGNSDTAIINSVGDVFVRSGAALKNNAGTAIIDSNGDIANVTNLTATNVNGGTIKASTALRVAYGTTDAHYDTDNSAHYRPMLPPGTIIGIHPTVANHGSFSSYFLDSFWNICDGSSISGSSKLNNCTLKLVFGLSTFPDLRNDVFLKGQFPNTADTSVSTGANTVTLSDTNLPAHVHAVDLDLSNGGGHTRDIHTWNGSAWTTLGDNNPDPDHTAWTITHPDLSHSHNLLIPAGAGGGGIYASVNSATYTQYSGDYIQSTTLSAGTHAMEHWHNHVAVGDIIGNTGNGPGSSSAISLFTSTTGLRYFNVVYFIKIN